MSGLARSIVEMPVLDRRRTDRISIASRGDFVCGRARSVGEMPRGAFPYCFDFIRTRIIYVCDVDARAVQAAPFYYLHLRRTARTLLSVPLAHGPIRRVRPAHDPVFVFSPGRCGSTLVSRILFEAGIPSVSEVDFFTQMSSVFWSNPHNPLREPFRRAMWDLTSDLTADLAGVPVVKLRAECCRAPELFVRDPAARSLVMFRSFESWARSTARAFNAGPRKAVKKYLRALSCYAFLERNSACHLLRYEDLVADPLAACERLARFLNVSIPVEAVLRAKQGDSQDGTPLEPGLRRPSDGREARFDATMRLWRSRRLVSARARLDVRNVWD